jgi:hypothetical protein
MMQLFPWLFRKRTSQVFRARSSSRDEQTDTANIRSIAAAIERSLTATEAEHAGLSNRLEDAKLRASIVVGDGTDEYLSREKEQTAWLGRLETELQNGRERLNVLQQNISHLKFLRAALFSRFPKAGQNEETGVR